MTQLSQEIVDRYAECVRFLKEVSPGISRGAYWTEFAKRFAVSLTTEGIVNRGTDYFPTPYSPDNKGPFVSERVIPRAEIDICSRFEKRKSTQLTDQWFELAGQRFHSCDRVLRHNYYFDRDNALGLL